jgi:hypothetical protein
MQADEFQTLKDSIFVIGVQNPITLYEGMVIDGWHRYSAANDLGVECPTKELGDLDPVDFVKSQNEARRHVTASQRALAITSIYAWRPSGKPAPGAGLAKTSAELAAMAGASERTIQQAKVVQAKATPEVKAAVKAGTMSVKQAAETVKPKKDKPAKPPKAEPVAEPTAPKEYAADGEPVAEYTALDAANETIGDLQAMLAVSNLGDVSAEDKTQAANLIAELRQQIKKLELNLRTVTQSRDQFQNENSELRKQITRQRKEIDRATGKRTT